MVAHISHLIGRLSVILYLGCASSLPKSAAQIRMTLNIVPQAISEAAGVTFFDLVNGVRVAAAKRLLVTRTRLF